FRLLSWLIYQKESGNKIEKDYTTLQFCNLSRGFARGPFGKENLKAAPLSRGRSDLDGMAQIVQNLLDHIQPQTGRFPPETAVLPGEKQVENAGKVLRRNAAARILYAQHNVRRRVICL